MKYLKKLFGGIPMTWPLVIVSAVLTAAYTAAMLLIPATENTSLRDIGGDIPCWIMFALIIISMLLTLIAGIIPSRIASRKDPVVALRSE